MSGFKYSLSPLPADSSTLLLKKITLTGAQIINPPSSLLAEILPAPGSGYVYAVISVNSRVINGSTPFAGNGIFFITYPTATTHLFTNSFTQITSSNSFRNWVAPGISSNVSNLVENQPLQLTWSSGAPSAGNGTFELWVYYILQSL